jgi:rod shape-determining protein MreD
MKPRVYLMILLLLLPVQASLLAPLSIAGVKPDLALVFLYIIGLLTGPVEAAFAGMGMGLIQDIGSASLIGLTGFTRGMIGLSAGLLGRRVLDLASPSNGIFLAGFSLLEGIVLALFLQVYYGAVPFWRVVAFRLLPEALYTGLAGVVLLMLISDGKLSSRLRRRTVQKEL